MYLGVGSRLPSGVQSDPKYGSADRESAYYCVDSHSYAEGSEGYSEELRHDGGDGFQEQF